MTLAFSPETIALDTGHFIGGRRVSGNGTLPVVRPSDGVSAALLPVADASVVDEAVRVATRALETSGWGRIAPRDRTRAMHRWADLVEAHAVELAQLEAVVSTVPSMNSRPEISRSLRSKSASSPNSRTRRAAQSFRHAMKASG